MKKGVEPAEMVQMGLRNSSTGDRGERVFFMRITDYVRFDLPLFRTAFLGDKWPNLDYLIEVIEGESARPFGFVQVRSTRDALNTVGRFIPMILSKRESTDLRKYKGPVYLAAVHEPTEQCYLKALHVGPPSAISRVSLQNVLNRENLLRLGNELSLYWNRPKIPPRTFFK